MISTEFLLTSLIVIIIPGTGVIFTVSTGLFQGWRESIIAAFGCTVGIIPHLLASFLGLSLVLHFSAAVFQGVKVIGVIYLLYLAWGMWRDTGALRFDATLTKQHFWGTMSKAVLINLLNPKLTIFFFAFLPLFISADNASPIGEMLVLSMIFMLMTFTVFVGYGVLASGVRRYVIHSPKVITGLKRSFALAFAGLGLKLAFTEQ